MVAPCQRIRLQLLRFIIPKNISEEKNSARLMCCNSPAPFAPLSYLIRYCFRSFFDSGTPFCGLKDVGNSHGYRGIFIEGDAMARRAGVFLAWGLVVVACFQIVGCAGTPTKFHQVVLTPSTPQIIGQGKTLPISALVLNDSSGAGVNCALNPATGSLTGTTSAATTYNAPPVVASATPVNVKA